MLLEKGRCFSQQTCAGWVEEEKQKNSLSSTSQRDFLFVCVQTQESLLRLLFSSFFVFNARYPFNECSLLLFSISQLFFFCILSIEVCLQKMSFSSPRVGPPPGLQPPPGFDPIRPEMATPAQRAELKKFLAWKDPQSSEDKADKLLAMYKLEDVAEAIRDKYGMLPQGWRSLVKSDQISRDLPKGLMRDFEAKISMKPESISDKKINEILDSEDRFVSTITELQTKYLDRLYEIFGSGQKDAIKALGITQEETNTIFEQLPAIVRFSQQLLQKLEIISLVRTQPITGEGRAIHVGNAFLEMAPKLHVYAPAITSYQQTLTILNECIARLKPTKEPKNLNFIQLWERITSSNDVLRGQQLQAVLITPMQRIPRYKMLLEQLVKDCDHPESIPVVQEALDLFSSAAKNMNEALRKHEKLLEFFGAGSELKPISSSGGTTKDGEVKVINTYVNKIIG